MSIINKQINKCSKNSLIIVLHFVNKNYVHSTLLKNNITAFFHTVLFSCTLYNNNYINRKTQASKTIIISIAYLVNWVSRTIKWFRLSKITVRLFVSLLFTIQLNYYSYRGANVLEEDYCLASASTQYSRIQFVGLGTRWGWENWQQGNIFGYACISFCYQARKSKPAAVHSFCLSIFCTKASGATSSEGFLHAWQANYFHDAMLSPLFLYLHVCYARQTNLTKFSVHTPVNFHKVFWTSLRLRRGISSSLWGSKTPTAC